jgi:hypothetical protein
VDARVPLSKDHWHQVQTSALPLIESLLEHKPAEQAVDAERRMERRYLTLAQKLIETKQPGQRRKRATQQELKAAYVSNPDRPNVKWCAQWCDWYFLASVILAGPQTLAEGERARRGSA